MRRGGIFAKRRWAVPAAAAVLVFAAALSGCTATMDRSIALSTDPVVAVSVGDAKLVSAYDLAQAMLRAGFSREEVLQLGPAVHNAIATSGGAQIRQGKAVSAILAVYGDKLYVTSLSRGTFALPLGLSVSG